MSQRRKHAAPRKRRGRWILILALIVILALIGGGIYFAFFYAPSEDVPNPVATIKIRNLGVMKAELYPKAAPITVANFIQLANSGFYDGLEVYRVIPGVLIQTGDPVGDGTGGAGFSIKGEFGANGIGNSLAHVRGTLSMCRQSGYDTASSQFFILQGTYPEYDGEYAAFGTLLKDGSLDVLDDAANRGVDAGYTPLERIYVESISVETYGAEYPVTRIGEKTDDAEQGK